MINEILTILNTPPVVCSEPTDITWIDHALELLQRVCVVGIVAYMAMRFTPVRKALGGIQTSWKNQAYTIIFFGLLAILGTHLALTHNSETGCWSWATHAYPLNPHDAIIGLRDLMVLVGGIFGGVWIGLGAGILAGLERSYVVHGSNVGAIAAFATVVVGTGAGLAQHFWPKWTISIKGILTISILGTIVQKLILLFSPLFGFISVEDAKSLVLLETTLPVLVANSTGCLLFLFVMKDLENDKIKIREQSAQLRALHAQVEPHFLNNMLTAVSSIIKRDPDRAKLFIAQLAEFLKLTRQSASLNSITLANELVQLTLLLKLQKVRFPDTDLDSKIIPQTFSYSEDIPQALLHYCIAPRTLQTLIENIFDHAFQGKKHIEISITGEDLLEENAMRLIVRDTGCGMTNERAELLGTQDVESASLHGNGSALHQIGQSIALAFDNKASINVKSELGTGTSVILTIPKRSEAW